MLLTSVLVAVVCLMVGYVRFRRRPDSRLPPFPVRPLPIVGNLLAMESDTRPLFKTWRKQCGDIFSLYIGGNLVVVLNGYDLIKEAFLRNGDVLSQRPPAFLDQATGIPVKGVVFSSGSYWKEHRIITIAILRRLGMGKSVLAEKVTEEVTTFTTFLSGLKHKPTDIHLLVFVGVCNIVCSILFGQRFEYKDNDFQDLMATMKKLLTDAGHMSLVNFFPWLQYLPGDFFKGKVIATSSRTLMKIITRLVKTKRRDLVNVEDINNFTEAYISEMKKKVEAGSPTFLDNESLYKIMLELFEAGTETTSTTINWCILYLIANPDVQEKVYQEINDKVGTERLPTMQDKAQLTYLNAVIMETQRLASILSLSVAHMCSDEITLKGHTIPKGTYIITNLDSVLHDTTTWGEDSMSFRPERFIDDNNKLEVPEEFIPFGIGRRVCLGEALAKMQLFLFLSSMIQKFKFLPANSKCVPTTEYMMGFVTSPVPYEVILEERIVI